MPEETRSESSSPAVAIEQMDSPPFQLRESIEEEPPRQLAAHAAKELTVKQTRAREAARGARARPTGAPIAGPSSAGPSSEIAERAEEQSGGPTPVRTSAAIASEPAENAKRVADAIAEAPSAVQQTTDDETLDAAMGSPEALPEESEKMEQTVINEIGSCVPVPGAVAQPSTERPAPWEIERALNLATGPQPTMQDVLAKWRDALWESLHGRWSEAGWEFARGVFHMLTRAATWRRVGEAVLNFLSRCIPGREAEVFRRSREIKELFRDLHEEPKEPGTWSNCAK